MFIISIEPLIKTTVTINKFIICFCEGLEISLRDYNTKRSNTLYHKGTLSICLDMK
jgi:hypothetical protein